MTTEYPQFFTAMNTLSPRDERDGFPFKGENKKTQVRQLYHQEELFPDGRNFG